MAFFRIPEAFTYARNAGADLSSNLYYAAHIDTDGDVVLAGAGEHCIGAIIEGAVADNPVTVQFGGVAKMIAGAAVAAGARVASDANGKVVAATSGDFVIGTALEAAGDANEIIPIALISGHNA